LDITVLDIITALGSVGTFAGFIITLVKMLKVAEVIKFQPEKLYGKEALERYDALLKKIPERSPGAFGPDEYTGGNKLTPQFEVERFHYDKQTMSPEWKKITKTIHYYYKENDKILVRGWRL
jgi:hypothetical protein